MKSHRRAARTLYARALAILLATLLVSCSAAPKSDAAYRDALLGTWAVTDGPEAEVTYHPDQSWTSWMRAEGEDQVVRTFRARGKWTVRDGAIHSTMLASDLELPGFELPYLSVEKLVSVGDAEYRYVCPEQGCTNTMRRVVRRAK